VIEQTEKILMRYDRICEYKLQCLERELKYIEKLLEEKAWMN
jgi:hypothetical protein